MSYTLSRKVESSFEEAIETVKSLLADEGFGVLSDIDVRATLKKKINVDFRNYRILGACNPTFAHQALQTEAQVGVMLPCNVIVQEYDTGIVEVSAVDPVASMQGIDNPALAPIAEQVRSGLDRVIQKL